MEARHLLRTFPTRAFIIGMALLMLVLLSAAGGYGLRVLTATPATTVVRVYQPAIAASQPHPNPDTRDAAGGTQSIRSHSDPDTLDQVAK